MNSHAVTAPLNGATETSTGKYTHQITRVTGREPLYRASITDQAGSDPLLSRTFGTEPEATAYLFLVTTALRENATPAQIRARYIGAGGDELRQQAKTILANIGRFHAANPNSRQAEAGISKVNALIDLITTQAERDAVGARNAEIIAQIRARRAARAAAEAEQVAAAAAEAEPVAETVQVAEPTEPTEPHPAVVRAARNLAELRDNYATSHGRHHKAARPVTTSRARAKAARAHARYFGKAN